MYTTGDMAEVAIIFFCIGLGVGAFLVGAALRGRRKR